MVAVGGVVGGGSHLTRLLQDSREAAPEEWIAFLSNSG